MKKKMGLVLFLFVFAAVCTVSYGAGFDFSEITGSVVEKNLSNGLKVIILPRHDAPVVSVTTWANVGGSDDPKEYSGLAHMFEHMSFKGTDTIGTTDSEKELVLMAKEDEAFEKYRLERLKGERADKKLLAEYRADFDKAIAEAYKVIIPNHFCNILQNEGADGLNAYTSVDQTAYIMSLPSNKFEFWAALESERFLHPRLREMYKEREVIIEERRMTVDNQPVRRLIEEFLCTAFKGHPYGTPLIGHMSDIINYDRKNAQKFYNKYYGPDNLTIAVVGDVEPAKALELLEKYFGKIPPRGKPELVATTEPEQKAEKRIKVYENTQNFLMMGWHVPAETHPDTPAISALCSILGNGETSRLNRRLVRDAKVSVSCSVASGWPGSKYPNLAVAFCYPAPSKSTSVCEKLILEEIEKLKSEPVSEEELNRVKNRAAAGLIMRLKDNLEAAQLLAQYQQIWGDWRELFNETKRIDAVTPADVQRVAKKYFSGLGKTVAVIENAEEAAQKAESEDASASIASADSSESVKDDEEVIEESDEDMDPLQELINIVNDIRKAQKDIDSAQQDVNEALASVEDALIAIQEASDESEDESLTDDENDGEGEIER